MIATGILLNVATGISTLVAFWIVYLWKRNPAVVDVGWATGLTIMGLAHCASAHSSGAGALLTGALVLLWAYMKFMQ